MRLKIFLTVALGLVLSAGSVFAQGRVNGVVKDRHGEPLIGANVYVKGTTISTISGLNGEFNINAPDSSSVLVITFNGYQNLEVAVRDLPTANLQLKPVVPDDFTGFYSNDSYYNVTANNTLILADDVTTGLETDVYQFLLGRVPGLEIISRGGNPWGQADYRLRGGYSPTNENAKPLFVVDGVYFGGDFAIDALNPDDIETVRFLKDAAATSQYGDAGSNGVVVITTRRPLGKTLAAGYNGNVSYNICDKDDTYKNSISTKHNANVWGVAGPVPYRASLGFNKINGVMENTGSDRLSAAFWVGPNLLDEHLKIDANGYFRNVKKRDHDTLNFNRFMGTLKVDYSVHSFEDLHVNILTSYAQNSNKLEDTTIAKKGFFFDGNLAYAHESEDNRHYVELKAGLIVNSLKGNAGFEEEEYYYEQSSDKIKSNSFYGLFNVALNRFYFKANARYNTYSDYNTASGSVSLAVKPTSLVALRVGAGFLGVVVKGKTDSLSNFNTLTYDLGIDIGGPKKRVYGSADFYVHHNAHVYSFSSIDDNKDVNKEMTLTNVGGEFMLNARVIDKKKVKWRIGGNLSYNVSVTAHRDLYNRSVNKDSYQVIGDKPLIYNVYESVYDSNGNPIPGLYVNRYSEYNNYGQQIQEKLDPNDRITTEDFRALPTAVAGLNTYFEVMDAYLQVDSHASINRFNLDMSNSGYVGTADIHNSTFLRIDNIVLGYKFKNIWKLSGRAYAAVQNPYVFTKYVGNEPEIYDGIDYGEYFNYQRPTIFSVGVKLNVNIKD